MAEELWVVRYVFESLSGKINDFRRVDLKIYE
jgi:hypothetical protein